MVTYDVLYVEDFEDQKELIEGLMDHFGLTYTSCSTLDEITQNILKNKYKTFLFDRKFPTDNEEDTEDINFPYAAEMVNFMYDNPKIVMLSGDSDGREEAEKFGAKFYKKGGKEFKVILDLKKMLTPNKTYSRDLESTLVVNQ